MTDIEFEPDEELEHWLEMFDQEAVFEPDSSCPQLAPGDTKQGEAA